MTTGHVKSPGVMLQMTATVSSLPDSRFASP